MLSGEYLDNVVCLYKKKEYGNFRKEKGTQIFPFSLTFALG